MATTNDDRCAKCPRCGDANPPVRAPRLALLAIPTMCIPLMALGAFLAILLPLNLLLVPCWVACASGIGELVRRLVDPKCGSCGDPLGSAASAAKLARRSSGPANERAMKGRLIGEAQ